MSRDDSSHSKAPAKEKSFISSAKEKATPRDQAHTQSASNFQNSIKKGIFSIGNDSSDYDSDSYLEDEPKKSKSNMFKDLLHGAKSTSFLTLGSSSVSKHSDSNGASKNLGHDGGSSNLSKSNLNSIHGAGHSLMPPHAPGHSINSSSSGGLTLPFAPLNSSAFSGQPINSPPSTGQMSSSAGQIMNGTQRSSPSSSPTSIASSQPPPPDNLSHDNLSQGIFKDLINPKRRNTSKESINAQAQLKPPFSSLNLGRRTTHDHDPTLVSRTISNSSLARSSSEVSLSEKYGKLEEVLGKGTFATVRLCCPINSHKKFAVKEFRKKKKEETKKEYVKKLIAEFCISSSLDHENVVKTVDLIQDAKRQWCVVMEYCAGGDLYTRIMKGAMSNAEIHCYTVQLIRGVQYMHDNGVVHKDLKPENLLLDSTHRILKITDFGVSEVFRTPFESKCKRTRGVAGSGPYIAPEEFRKGDYESQPVDICYGMLSHLCPWKIAQDSDARYKIYLDHLNNFGLFEKYAPPIKLLLVRFF